MTRDEIMQLEGRELDKAVAEKVMGYRPIDVLKQGITYMDGRGKKAWIKNPNYSTDISAAWEVVEELSGKYSFVLQREGDYLNDEDVYECRIGGLNELVVAKKAPLAICRAALLAVMEVES